MREVAGNPQFTIWSFAFITDLRPQVERDAEADEGMLAQQKRAMQPKPQSLQLKYSISGREPSQLAGFTLAQARVVLT